MEIQKTGYCKTGLGIGKPECCACGDKCTKKRIISGGPDIAGAFEKLQGQRQSDPGLVLIVPDSVNSLEALSKFIQDSGFKRGSAEYMELYKKYHGNLKSEYSHLN